MCAVLLAEGGPLQDAGPSAEVVERAEMLLEASHAGQVLLSDSAARLAGHSGLPAGAALRCLGAFRLNDLGPARSIHQLEHPSLAPAFPPLRTLDSCPNNLRTQPTPFIGRKEELAAVRDALISDSVQLLTLTGAAGTGKTRLALQAAAGLADRFEHGLFFVDLASLREPPQVVVAIAAALGFREAGGRDRSLLDSLADSLRNKRALLMLDNFEHLLPAAAQVADLLAGCPRLKVLATSREALRLRAERVVMVPPMRVPARGQSAAVAQRSEAVRLFAERAAAARSDFALSPENCAAVAEICIRLDGLPLAIELAAARVSSLPLRTLLENLRSRLTSLTEGPRDLPARQRTLKSELDWSHELLTEGERRILRRVAVFPGGCTLDAAEAVCLVTGENLDVLRGLTSLADKSLIGRMDAGGEPRFRMLETIREYALARLVESGEADPVGARRAAYFLEFAEQTESELYGPDQERWLVRIMDEWDNIRAVLEWFRDREARAEGLRLAGALGWFWFRRARYTDGLCWLELFRSAAMPSDPPGPRAKASYYLGWIKACAGRSFWGNPEGKDYFRESLELWREAGNQRGIALSQVWLGCEEGVESDESRALADESVAVARETGDPWAISFCLKIAYSNLRRPDRDPASRRAALEESVALARKSGDPFLLCQALNGMGNVYGWTGELEAAEPWYLESLRIAREIGDIWSILDAMNCLADGYLGLGRIRKAKVFFRDGLRAACDLGARGYLAWFIGGLYRIARQEGRPRRAARLGAASEAVLNPGSSCDPRFAGELGLDGETAQAEWTIGQSMTVEEVTEYALSEE
jgi:predicted ATPase